MYCRKSRIEWLSACDLCLKYDGLVQRVEVAGTKYSFFLPILLRGISKKNRTHIMVFSNILYVDYNKIGISPF